MNIQQVIKENRLELLFQQGSFGIEKESQRVHADGAIVVTEHPKCFGNSNRFCRKPTGINYPAK